MIRTLYVDDELALLELGKIFLEKSGDFQVYTANSAMKAFEMLATDSFDVIVSDYMMPDMDGIAFLKKLRQNGNQIPFIIFTGRGREEIVIQALDEGADLYLQKGGQPKAQFAELAHKIRLVVTQKQMVAALKKSEDQYRRIVETADEGIWVLDRKSTTLFVNERMAAMIKFSPEEITGTSFFDYMVPEDFPDHEAKIAERWKGASARYERRFRCKDGTVIWTLVSATPVIEDCMVTGSFGMFADITDRKLAEDALRKSEERYRALFRDNPSMFFTVDAEGKVISVNQFGASQLGYTVDELEGQSVLKVFYPEDQSAVTEQLKKCLQSPGQVFYWQFRKVRKDNSILWVEEYVRAVSGPEGIPHVLVVCQDITDRKRAEDALRESEERYRTIFEMTGAATIIIEKDMTISLANSGFARQSGYSPEELEGRKRWTEFVVKEDLERMKQYHYNRREDSSHAPRVYEFRFVSRSGETRHCIVHVGVIPGTTKSVASVVDINDRVLAEQALLQRNEELNAAYEQLTATEEELRRLYNDLEKRVNERTAELHAANTALQSENCSRVLAEEALFQSNKKLKLLSSITRHDINNQLSVLQGYLRLLQKKNPDPAFSDYFTSITNASKRISSMIHFTKEYEMVGVTAPVWQDIRTLVTTAAKDASLGQVQLKNDLQPGIEVYADALIVKVLYNLIDNAIRYGGKITTIRFSVEECDEDRIIVCEDDGAGIVAEEKEKIFEPGFGKNTGLGLALSKEILTFTDITISETGEPGKGARFEISVPKRAYRFSDVSTPR